MESVVRWKHACQKYCANMSLALRNPLGVVELKLGNEIY